MNYYGTDLNQAGHYLWALKDNDIQRSRLNFNDLPFNPECLPYSEAKIYLPNGFVKHYNFAGFSICAIQGSCSDKRTGSKSIFFVEQNYTPSEMKDKILSITIAKRIIQQMPFEVKW